MTVSTAVEADEAIGTFEWTRTVSKTNWFLDRNQFDQWRLVPGWVEQKHMPIVSRLQKQRNIDTLDEVVWNNDLRGSERIPCGDYESFWSSSWVTQIAWPTNHLERMRCPRSVTVWTKNVMRSVSSRVAIIEKETLRPFSCGYYNRSQKEQYLLVEGRKMENVEVSEDMGQRKRLWNEMRPTDWRKVASDEIVSATDRLTANWNDRSSDCKLNWSLREWPARTDPFTSDPEPWN